MDAAYLSKVPDYLSDNEAATIPLVSLTAYQALKALNPKEGKTIFISGATGGFGSLAIPLAKSMGLKIIVSGNKNNKDYVLSIGASQFIDKNEDFSKIISNVDYVIDTVGDSELEKEFAILKNGGHLVSIKGSPNKEFANSIGLSGIKKWIITLSGKKWDRLAAKNGQKYTFIYAQADSQQLNEVSKILEKIEYKPAIDSIFTLDRANDALQKVIKGHLIGKVILKIE